LWTQHRLSAPDNLAEIRKANKIGRELLSHLEKLRRLRVEIDKGIQSLDAGRGKALDIEGFLRDVNARHGGV
jgi:hypothetical protein